MQPGCGGDGSGAEEDAHVSGTGVDRAVPEGEALREHAEIAEGNAAERQDRLEKESAAPDAMLSARADPAGEARGQPGSGEEERDLPECVQEAGEEPRFDGFHSSPLPSSSRLLSLAMVRG